MFEALLKRLGFGPDDPPDNGKLADLDYEYAKTRYTEYIAARQNSLKESLEISDRFDKAILALSGGSLGLSLTFLEKFAPHPLSWTLAILFVAWAMLLLSILSGVVALFSVQAAIQGELKDIENDYRIFLAEFEAGRLPGPPPAKQNSSKEKTRDVRKHNLFSIAALGIGLVLLCLFSMVNLFSTSLVPREQVVEMRLQLPEGITAMPPNATNGSLYNRISPA